LNFLLQSAGAIISKLWYNTCYDELTAAGFTYGVDWSFLAHVHDEVQFAVAAERAEELGLIAVGSSRLAGDALGLRIAINSEYKVGDNWAECH
jgi:DNA polymerase I-like protein with 3'-5' exonuclease and polymerase domains